MNASESPKSTVSACSCADAGARSDRIWYAYLRPRSRWPYAFVQTDIMGATNVEPAPLRDLAPPAIVPIVFVKSGFAVVAEQSVAFADPNPTVAAAELVPEPGVLLLVLLHPAAASATPSTPAATADILSLILSLRCGATIESPGIVWC